MSQVGNNPVPNFDILARYLTPKVSSIPYIKDRKANATSQSQSNTKPFIFYDFFFITYIRHSRIYGRKK